MPKKHIIPDLLDEQRVAELLSNAGDIIELHEKDPAAQIHVNGFTMAARLHDVAKARRKAYVQRTLEDTQDGLEAIRDMNYADQLAAHHLDMLDRLTTA